MEDQHSGEEMVMRLTKQNGWKGYLAGLRLAEKIKKMKESGQSHHKLYQGEVSQIYVCETCNRIYGKEGFRKHVSISIIN